MSQVDIRITRARARLLEKHPFFGWLAMRLIIRERADIRTLATDGAFLYYCGAFLDRIPEAELVFCIAHEVLHCALSHMTRRGNRPWDIWQAATDYVVNLMLKDAGFTVPAWVKYFDEKYRGLNVEEVAELLMQEAQKQKEEEQAKQQGGGQGSIDHMPDDQDPDEAEGEDDWDMPGQNDDDLEEDGDGEFDEEAEGHADGEQAEREDNADQGDAESEGQGSQGGSDEDGRSPGQTPSGAGDGSGDDVPRTTQGGKVGAGTADRETLAPSHGDPGGCGEVLDAAPPYEHAKLDEVAGEWQVYTRQAANVERRRGEGKLPGFLEELIEELDTPRTDWREELRAFVDPQSNTKDYSWRSPNRRMMSQGYYVPGLISDGIDHLAVIIDDSGSVDTDWLRKFGGETQAILDEGGVDRVTLIFADDGVHTTASYQKGDIMDFTAHGRGGTDFAPSFAWINENLSDVGVAAYLTDLDCTSYGPEPNYPVLWAAYAGPDGPQVLKERMARVPFGHCVQLIS